MALLLMAGAPASVAGLARRIQSYPCPSLIGSQLMCERSAGGDLDLQ